MRSFKTIHIILAINVISLIIIAETHDQYTPVTYLSTVILGATLTIALVSFIILPIVSYLLYKLSSVQYYITRYLDWLWSFELLGNRSKLQLSRNKPNETRGMKVIVEKNGKRLLVCEHYEKSITRIKIGENKELPEIMTPHGFLFVAGVIGAGKTNSITEMIEMLRTDFWNAKQVRTRHDLELCCRHFANTAQTAPTFQPIYYNDTRLEEALKKVDGIELDSYQFRKLKRQRKKQPEETIKIELDTNTKTKEVLTGIDRNWIPYNDVAKELGLKPDSLRRKLGRMTFLKKKLSKSNLIDLNLLKEEQGTMYLFAEFVRDELYQQPCPTP